MEFFDKSNIETALSKLEKVRQLLIDAYEETKWPDTFGNPISTHYPIKSQTSLQYHGWCQIIVPKNAWTRRMNMERAKEFSVLGLTVHLKANSEDESMLPIELLLPTFIHELAHSVTAPEKWRLNSIPTDLKEGKYEGLKPTDWVILHHNPTFYVNFAHLLQMAEKLSIYSLPSSPNKYSVRALKRFDQLDPEAAKSGLNFGNSPMFGGSPSSKSASGCSIRIMITDTQRTKQKPITISRKDACVASILKEAKTKLNLRKKPTVFLDVRGNEISEKELNSVEQDSLLIVK